MFMVIWVIHLHDCNRCLHNSNVCFPVAQMTGYICISWLKKSLVLNKKDGTLSMYVNIGYSHANFVLSLNWVLYVGYSRLHSCHHQLQSYTQEWLFNIIYFVLYDPQIYTWLYEFQWNYRWHFELSKYV